MTPIRSLKEAAALLGMSVRNLQRLSERGEGPDRVRLGYQRVGFTDEALVKWVNERTETGRAA